MSPQIARSILDTDTLSEIFKGVGQQVLSNTNYYLDEHPQLTFTSVSVHEVLYGLHAKAAARQIRDFHALIAPHDEKTPDSRAFRIAAEIRAALQRVGTPIGAFDPLIAACALSRDLPLVTGHLRHYGYIQSLG